MPLLRSCASDESVLNAVLTLINSIGPRVAATPPTLDGILGLRGVIEVVEEDEPEDQRRALETELLACFDRALEELAGGRRLEGAALAHILKDRLEEIEILAVRAEAAPGRRPDAIRARLARAGRKPAAGF